MEIDSKLIINIIIATVIALILGSVFALLGVGFYSYILGIVIGCAIAGFLDKNVDNSLIIGAAAGLLVSILQGVIAPLILTKEAASLFPIMDSFIGLMMVGAIVAGAVAIIADVKS